jgi:Sec-independent protein translocase protein TatA
MPMLTRPVSLILVICVVLMFASQLPAYKRMMARLMSSLRSRIQKPAAR